MKTYRGLGSKPLFREGLMPRYLDKAFSHYINLGISIFPSGYKSKVLMFIFLCGQKKIGKIR